MNDRLNAIADRIRQMIEGAKRMQSSAEDFADRIREAKDDLTLPEEGRRARQDELRQEGAERIERAYRDLRTLRREAEERFESIDLPVNAILDEAKRSRAKAHLDGGGSVGDLLAEDDEDMALALRRILRAEMKKSDRPDHHVAASLANVEKWLMKHHSNDNVRRLLEEKQSFRQAVNEMNAKAELSERLVRGDKSAAAARIKVGLAEEARKSPLEKRQDQEEGRMRYEEWAKRDIARMAGLQAASQAVRVPKAEDADG